MYDGLFAPWFAVIKGVAFEVNRTLERCYVLFASTFIQNLIEKLILINKLPPGRSVTDPE